MTLESLNSKQQEAAQLIQGPVMVFAGAGSGKTRTLTYRIANMISKGINPNHILAITFTNKATNEMRSRLHGLVGTSSSELTISTFHSLCARILRNDINAIDYKRDFQIIDDEDQLKVIKEVLDEGNYDKKNYSPKSIRKKLNFHKVFATKSEINIENIIFDKYEKLMKEYNLLDFEDLLIKVELLFSKNPEILEKYRKKFQHILVDEFQDTDMYQYKIIKMLADVHRNLFVVGDDDQSIYGFRGANYKNIDLFKSDFPELKIIILEQNYRSTQKLLEGANNLIANNVDRQPKTLFSEIAGSNDDLKIHQAMDQKDEVDYVISNINALIRKGYEYKDIAVLYRSSAVARNFELGFIQSDIRYKIYGGISYLRRKEIKDMIAYLRLLTFSDDVLSFKRVVNEPSRGIGLKTVETVVDYAKANKITIFEAINQSSEFIKSKAKVLNEFKDIIEELVVKLEDTDLVEIYNELLEKTKYIESLDEDDKEDRVENLMEFKSILYNIENNGEIASRKDKLIAAFDEAILSNDRLSSQKQDNDGVTLSTIHSVKGLEFDAVFLVALENGVFPNIMRFKEDESLEEERRIAYVAVTRAKNVLFLTCAAKRMLFGQWLRQSQSQFLIEYVNNKGVFQEQNKVALPSGDFIKLEKKENDYSIGEHVIHTTYGEGMVVSLGEHNIGKICFTKQGLIKSFDMTHHSISKKNL